MAVTQGGFESLGRREFLLRSAGVGAGLFCAPSLLGGEKRWSANDRISVALIGCGGMGNANTRSFMNKAEVQVVAVADPDRARRESTRDAVEQKYAEATRSGTYSGCADYNDFREILARDDVDAVIVASPDNWHSVQVAMAAAAGKDIYGEKPLSLTIGEGRAMSDAVARHQRIFQTGSQQRSDRRFRLACELVRNGYLGKVERINVMLPPGKSIGTQPEQPVPEGFDYDMWLGPAPWAPYNEFRTHYNFRFNFDYSGGKITDWAAHHVDIVQWALGTMESGPTKIVGKGVFPTEGMYDTAVEFDVTATYASGTELRIRNHGPGGETGVEFLGSEGRLFVKRGRIEVEDEEWLQPTFNTMAERLYVSNDHHQNFLDCMRSRRETVAPIEHAHRSIAIAHLGNIAMRTGRVIRWDPATETIKSDAGASRFLNRSMRGPWRV